jgi:hypothetical protein
MIDPVASPAVDAQAVESLLREDLAHGDAMLGTIQPILRHLLLNEDSSLFSEEVLARVRGMLADIARQLAELAEQPDLADELMPLLASHGALLGHLHAVAIEMQLTDRLSARLGVDPVLSPLLQALIASSRPDVSAEAMTLLAAQARFVQVVRRMQMPLGELPGDLLHAALLTLRDVPGAAGSLPGEAESRLRSQYDEAKTRIGQLARTVSSMGAGASAALGIGHAGVALFLSALGLASGQDRDQVALAATGGQMARLALSLRAAGIKPTAIEEQFVALHPDALMPPGFELLSADRAAAILAGASPYANG